MEAKGDETPVTIADRKAEAEMRRLLAEALPEHGIFGEEEGLHLPKECSGFLWVLDPIDGTKSFITGVHHAQLDCECHSTARLYCSLDSSPLTSGHMQLSQLMNKERPPPDYM